MATLGLTDMYFGFGGSFCPPNGFKCGAGLTALGALMAPVVTVVANRLLV